MKNSHQKQRARKNNFEIVFYKQYQLVQIKYFKILDVQKNRISIETHKRTMYILSFYNMKERRFFNSRYLHIFPWIVNEINNNSKFLATNLVRFRIDCQTWKKNIARFTKKNASIEIDNLCSNPLTSQQDDLHWNTSTNEHLVRYRRQSRTKYM